MDSANENEEWCSVKKTKKKKQKQRALNLQQFHSETGSDNSHLEVIHVGSSSSDPAGGEGRWGTAGTPEAADPATTRPDLSAEEELVAASVHSYFTDLLTRCGAIRVDDPVLVKELTSLAEEGREVIERFGGLLPFLAGRPGEICVVDSFLCLAEASTVGQAKNKALDIILNNVMPRTSVRSNGTAPSPSAKPAETNAWVKRLPATTSAPSLPNIARAPGAPTTSTNGLAHKAQVLPENNTLSPTLYSRDIFSSSLTGRPAVVPHQETGEEARRHLAETCDALTNKLSEATGRNHQLVQKLDEKTREADGLRAKLQMQKDALDRVEREKQHLSHEVNRLNALLKDSVTPATKDPGAVNGSSTSTSSGKNSNELILSLQSQLESERLNSRNLKQQLDIERSFSGRPKMPVASVGLGLGGHHHQHQTSSAPTSMDLSGAGTAFLPGSGVSNSLGLTNLSLNFGSRSNQSSIGSRNPPGLMGLGVPPPGVSSPLLGSSSTFGKPVDFVKEPLSAPVNPTVSKNKLLLDNLSRDHPGLTDNDLQMALRELRQKFGNLSVMPLDQLTGMLRAHISEGTSK